MNYKKEIELIECEIKKQEKINSLRNGHMQSDERVELLGDIKKNLEFLEALHNGELSKSQLLALRQEINELINIKSVQ